MVSKKKNTAGFAGQAPQGAHALWIFPALAFFAPLAFLVVTLQGRVNFADSAEFVTCSALLGGTHPSGYPLYTLLGHLFQQLPLGTPSYCQNLLSAFAGAGAMFFLYLITFRVIRHAYFSLITVLCFTAGITFWGQARIIEVYSLHTFFASVSLYLVVRYIQEREKPRSGWILVLLGLSFGLGFANHLSTFLFFPMVVLFLLFFAWRVLAFAALVAAPFGVAFFIAQKYGTLYAFYAAAALNAAVLVYALIQKKKNLAAAAGMFLVFFAALQIYWYTPLEYFSNTGQKISWGDNLDKWDGFLTHTIGKEYLGVFGGMRPEEYPQRLVNILAETFNQFQIPGVFLMLLGLIEFYYQSRREFFMFTVYFLSVVAYCTWYRIPDNEGYLLPAFLALAPLVGYGFIWLIRNLVPPGITMERAAAWFFRHSKKFAFGGVNAAVAAGLIYFAASGGFTPGVVLVAVLILLLTLLLWMLMSLVRRGWLAEKMLSWAVGWVLVVCFAVLPLFYFLRAKDIMYVHLYAEDYAAAILENCEKPAIIMTNEDGTTFSMWYANYVLAAKRWENRETLSPEEHARAYDPREVAILDVRLYSSRQWFRQHLKTRHHDSLPGFLWPDTADPPIRFWDTRAAGDIASKNYGKRLPDGRQYHFYVSMFDHNRNNKTDPPDAKDYPLDLRGFVSVNRGERSGFLNELVPKTPETHENHLKAAYLCGQIHEHSPWDLRSEFAASEDVFIKQEYAFLFPEYEKFNVKKSDALNGPAAALAAKKIDDDAAGLMRASGVEIAAVEHSWVRRISVSWEFKSENGGWIEYGRGDLDSDARWGMSHFPMPFEGAIEPAPDCATAGADGNASVVSGESESAGPASCATDNESNFPNGWLKPPEKKDEPKPAEGKKGPRPDGKWRVRTFVGVREETVIDGILYRRDEPMREQSVLYFSIKPHR
jgi:hypothetical protein